MDNSEPASSEQITEHVDIEIAHARYVNLTDVALRHDLDVVIGIMAATAEFERNLGLRLHHGTATLLPADAINQLGLLKSTSTYGGLTMAYAKVGGIDCIGLAVCNHTDIFHRKFGSLLARLRLLEDVLTSHCNTIDSAYRTAVLGAVQAFENMLHSGEELHPKAKAAMDAFIHSSLDNIQRSLEAV